MNEDDCGRKNMSSSQRGKGLIDMCCTDRLTSHEKLGFGNPSPMETGLGEIVMRYLGYASKFLAF